MHAGMNNQAEYWETTTFKKYFLNTILYHKYSATANNKKFLINMTVLRDAIF